jgi:hypothetical protein
MSNWIINGSHRNYRPHHFPDGTGVCLDCGANTPDALRGRCSGSSPLAEIPLHADHLRCIRWQAEQAQRHGAAVFPVAVDLLLQLISLAEQSPSIRHAPSTPEEPCPPL